jgi:hypothetical protein
MVERTVKPLFEERLGRLRRAIAGKDQSAAQMALNAILGMSICDPTMGSAPFLRSAFDYLSEGYPLKAGHQMSQWFQASKVVASSDGHPGRF